MPVSENRGKKTHDLLIARVVVLVQIEQRIALQINRAVSLPEIVQGLFENEETALHGNLASSTSCAWRIRQNSFPLSSRTVTGP